MSRFLFRRSNNNSHCDNRKNGPIIPELFREPIRLRADGATWKHQRHRNCGMTWSTKADADSMTQSSTYRPVFAGIAY